MRPWTFAFDDRADRAKEWARRAALDVFGASGLVGRKDNRPCQALPGLKPLDYTDRTSRNRLGVACDNERDGKREDNAGFG